MVGGESAKPSQVVRIHPRQQSQSFGDFVVLQFWVEISFIYSESNSTTIFKLNPLSLRTIKNLVQHEESISQ